MVQTEPVDILHDARDRDDECSSTNKRGRSHGHDSSFDDRKVKQRHGTSASPPARPKAGSHS